MASLKRRLTVAASVALLASLGATGVVLDTAFRTTNNQLIQARLQAQAYAILAGMEESASGQLEVVDAPPDPRLATPGSGLYAQLSAESGQVLWVSPSQLGESIRFHSGGVPGQPAFVSPDAGTGEAGAFALSFAVAWEKADGTLARYEVQLVERGGEYAVQLREFRQQLLLWFAVAAAVTLGVQVIVLNWGMQPLRRAAQEIAEIRRGERSHVSDNHVDELAPMTTSVNQLIDGAEQRLTRYRDALGNLAHTLKTPLAVLQTQGRGATPLTPDLIEEQVERMDRAISYHLKRASAAGARALGPAIPVAEHVDALVRVMHKVYADRQLTITGDASPAARFHGDEGDLSEMLGNVLDNACKWARSSVAIRAATEADTLVLTVTDDGPGISEEAERQLVERGARADPDVPGQGIGLAVVQQLVREVYGGQLSFARTGGFAVRIELPGHPTVE